MTEEQYNHHLASLNIEKGEDSQKIQFKKKDKPNIE